ncbi:MAG: hypothetical protein ACRESK_03960 [Gammaproteobacteria bacterium]
MQVWEQVLLGIAALLLVFIFWPGVKVAMDRSRQAQNKDWQGALVPVGLVVLFIVVLIIIAKS